MAKELVFKANLNQKNALEGLAYWIANSAWQEERLEHNDPEKERTRETIHSLFNECDKLKIPFWVQNSVIAYADDWRRYKTTYTRCELAKKGITI